MTHDLFIPPAGNFRPIPNAKRDSYYELYSKLGTFEKNEYDLDICVLYRQVDDLRVRYKKIGPHKYDSFINTIRENVSIDLEKLNLNVDFYLNHFYCVIRPDNPSYFSYLGLFFALSDPLDVFQKLEYHLTKYNEVKDFEDGSIEFFLGKMEYLVCNYLRTNRFPEDYIVKHESIIRWIYSRKDFYFYQSHFHNKLDALITALNKALPAAIPDILKEVDEQNIKNKKKPKICVIENKRETLFKDLMGYFSDESKDTLRSLLDGTANESDMIIFMGQANQLLDVFRIYCEEEFILSDKRSVAEWVRTHFMFMSETMKSPESSAAESSEKVMYRQHLPTKNKRISLSGLNRPRESFYKKKK